MKTTIIAVITAAAVLFVARAQLAPPAAKPEPEPTLAPPPVASRGGEGALRAGEGALRMAPVGQPNVAVNDPLEGSTDAPVRGSGVRPSGVVPRGSASVTQNYFRGFSQSVPSTTSAISSQYQKLAGNGTQTAAQMLRESELKVLRHHYEGVLQRALEAEEKYQLATTDADGNAKPQPDADASLHKERAAVLRRYADRLQGEIAKVDASAGWSGAGTRGTGGMGQPPMVAVPAPVGAGMPGMASGEDERALKQYPLAGNGRNRLSSSSLRGYVVGSDTADVSGRITLLHAQIRAQQAALNLEEVSLEEAAVEANRARELVEQKVVSGEEATRKEFAVKKSKARLDQLKAEIAATEAELAMAEAQRVKSSTPPTTPPRLEAIPGAMPGSAAPAPSPRKGAKSGTGAPAAPSQKDAIPGAGAPAPSPENAPVTPPAGAPPGTSEAAPKQFLLEITTPDSGPTFRLDGAEIDHAELHQQLSKLGSGPDPQPLVIRANETTSAALVTDVLKSATDAGIGQISLAPALPKPVRVLRNAPLAKPAPEPPPAVLRNAAPAALPPSPAPVPR